MCNGAGMSPPRPGRPGQAWNLLKMCDSCAELAGPPSALRANQILDGIQDRGVRRGFGGGGGGRRQPNVAEFDLLAATFLGFLSLLPFFFYIK